MRPPHPKRGSRAFCRIADNSSVPEVDDPVEVFPVPVFVRDHYDSLVQILIDLPEEIEHHPGILGIKVGARLISKEDVRPVHHGTGDRDALLLAAGEFPGQVVPPVAQADLLEYPEAVLSGLLLGAVLPEHRRDGDILHDREIGDECVILEDKPELVEPEHGLLVIGQEGDIHPVDHDPAGGGNVEEPEHVQEGGLPAPARPGDPEKLAMVDGGGNAIESLDFGISHVVDLPQIRDLDHGIRPSWQSGYPPVTPGRRARSRQ